MTTQPLVSIVTPCFNGSLHVSRLIESILNQTETDVELIFVNDGSTDDTEEVVMEYLRDFKSTLKRFHYVYQPNGGLGSAINAGLKHVEGRNLVWPDSDDYLEPTSLARRATVLQHSPQFAVVTSDAYIRDAAQLNVIGRISDRTPHNDDPWQFEHLLRGESIFSSGTHMARMDAFDETHPGRQIYPARRGQNWQMLLPLYYKYKRFYLDSPLYNYVVSTESMSRGDDSLDKQIQRANEHRDIKLATLSTIAMPASERTHYEALVHEVYNRKLLRSGMDFGRPVVARNAYNSLKLIGAHTLRDTALAFAATSHAPKGLVRWVRRIARG